jgi:uroporphyrinogen decarboxylase
MESIQFHPGLNKMTLSHRERVFKALNHETPDRVPIDDAWMSYVRMDTWDALRKYLNAKDDEDARRNLGFDFRYLTIDLSDEFKKQTKFYYPFGLFKPVTEDIFEDEWGIRMQITSSKLHWRYVYHPLANVEDPDEYEFPKLDVPGRFDNAIKTAKLYKDKYVLQAFLHQTLFEFAWALRGFTKFLHDLYVNEKFVNKLLDKLLKYRIETGKRYIEIGADIIQLGDDFGTQRGMVIPPSLWRKYFKPRMKILIHELKRHSRNSVYIFYHSDGDIKPIIPELIEIGVQILNPIQPECMDPVEIKRKYGDKLVLHGTISVQTTLPFSTVKDVEREVISIIKKCGRDGGLVIAPTHAPQPPPYTPVENIIKMYEVARKYKLL